MIGISSNRTYSYSGSDICRSYILIQCVCFFLKLIRIVFDSDLADNIIHNFMKIKVHKKDYRTENI